MLTPEFATPADLALCRQMIKQGSKSFHLASLLLPNVYRQHARALYGFCRMADDLVDKAADPQHAVETLAKRLDAIYAGSPSEDPTDRAFADVVLKFAIPRAVPDALIEGFAWDAQGRHYQTLSDVTAYAVRVAGTVGVMMSLIMGERRPEALSRAIDLGVAMQFSNIARDVEEDEKLNRCYIPQNWLMQTKSAAATRLVHEAEVVYARAGQGIAMLPRSCRASINAARLLYREIGLAAERQQHSGRAFVPLARKLMLVAKAVCQTPFLQQDSKPRCLVEGQFLVDAVLQMPAPKLQGRSLENQIDWLMKMFISVETRKS
jgi:15-cis-phytoene synthase